MDNFFKLKISKDIQETDHWIAWVHRDKFDFLYLSVEWLSKVEICENDTISHFPLRKRITDNTQSNGENDCISCHNNNSLSIFFTCDVNVRVKDSRKEKSDGIPRHEIIRLWNQYVIEYFSLNVISHLRSDMYRMLHE